MALPCPRCGLVHQCICSQIPNLSDSHLLLSLLMHPEEIKRDTNTGRWLKEALPNCETYIWQRTQANQDLLDRINQKNRTSFLVFPTEDSLTDTQAIEQCKAQGTTPHFIILDGTWQEARKMRRKSAWLDKLPTVTLSTSNITSQYQLRRNQESGHLCTLEVANVLLASLGEQTLANQLEQFFLNYMKVYQADKSGHIWQKKQ
ncbi:tRNA-uridine aminocarboxypropyltransferase [Vibrio tritonius]|uniref:tRNA-uridine aminocarboxypropyltransferase n=1 Tax=Vibrio tritonius TaxID=1435069 RepID=UPI00315C92A4